MSAPASAGSPPRTRTAARDRGRPNRTPRPRPGRWARHPPRPPHPAGRPNTPDQALALTDQQALDELNLESTESSTRISGLAGSWVPQVSSKCVGVRVDIEPNYFPDGVADIEHVTIQQLLAFNLSMHNRFGALTVRPTQLGVVSDQATTGACAQQAVWTSVVPQQFGSAQDANTWCAANMPPIQECGARYVVRPGERSTLVMRQ